MGRQKDRIRKLPPQVGCPRRLGHTLGTICGKWCLGWASAFVGFRAVAAAGRESWLFNWSSDVGPSASSSKARKSELLRCGWRIRGLRYVKGERGESFQSWVGIVDRNLDFPWGTIASELKKGNMESECGKGYQEWVPWMIFRRLFFEQINL